MANFSRCRVSAPGARSRQTGNSREQTYNWASGLHAEAARATCCGSSKGAAPEIVQRPSTAKAAVPSPVSFALATAAPVAYAPTGSSRQTDWPSIRRDRPRSARAAWLQVTCKFECKSNCVYPPCELRLFIRRRSGEEGCVRQHGIRNARVFLTVAKNSV